MTLNMTIVAPWGIWQSADRRLTNPSTGKVEDDASIKHVAVRCSDGTALITYTGIGRVHDVPTSDWIRHLIRGENRTVDQTLIMIREAATSTFPAIAPGFELTFNIGAFLGKRPWAAVITNRQLNGSVQTRFETSAIQVDQHNPGVMITGTRLAVSAADSSLLTKAARNKPKRTRFYHELLAGVNLRASSHPTYGRLISPTCITVHMPAKGEPVNFRSHDPTAAATNQRGGGIPIVLFGIDMTEISSLVTENLLQRQASVVLDEAEASRRREEVAKQSVVPGNLLKK